MADTTVEFHSEFAIERTFEPQGATCAWAEDRVLAEGLRSGNEAAYEALILRFEHPVFGVVSRLLEDPADAPDVVQDVFVKVFRNIASFRLRPSLWVSATGCPIPLPDRTRKCWITKFRSWWKKGSSASVRPTGRHWS